MEWYNAVVGNAPSPRPITQMKLGELQEFGKELIAGNRGNTALGLGPNEGSSAMGGFQVVNGTRARHANKLYGANWGDRIYDAETQEAIGKSIWEEAKANKADLTKVWTGLAKYKEYTPADFNAMEWDQIRPLILAKESGMPLSASQRPSVAVRQEAPQQVAPQTPQPFDDSEYRNELQAIERRRAAELADRSNRYEELWRERGLAEQSVEMPEFKVSVPQLQTLPISAFTQLKPTSIGRLHVPPGRGKLSFNTRVG